MIGDILRLIRLILLSDLSFIVLFLIVEFRELPLVVSLNFFK